MSSDLCQCNAQDAHFSQQRVAISKKMKVYETKLYIYTIKFANFIDLN